MIQPYPNGIEEVVKTYGDYHPFLRSDYTIAGGWERAILGTCWLPLPLRLGWEPAEVFKIRCHALLVNPLQEIFGTIVKARVWDKLETFDGCYSWRPKRNGTKLSAHCWGIALDLNAQTNKMGTLGEMDPEIVRIFEAAGWTWGGRWDEPDPMHFQACKGY